MAEPVLEVKNLKKYFKVGKKDLKAVDNVSFSVDKGEILGIVGESGCGKTTCESTTGRRVNWARDLSLEHYSFSV